MQQNSFVVPTKPFSISIKFWLLKKNILLRQRNALSGQQNVLSGQQKKFCCIHFFLSVGPKKCLLDTTIYLVYPTKLFF